MELLPFVEHATLRVGRFQHLGEESVSPSLRAQSAKHLRGVLKLIFRILHIVHGEAVAVHAIWFGDKRVHKRAKSERSLSVAVLQARVQQVFKLREVGVRHLRAAVI